MSPMEKQLLQVKEQYRSLVCGIPFVRAPCIMDLVSIIGENNRHISQRLFERFFEIRDNAEKELSASLKESNKVCILVVFKLYFLLSRAYESLLLFCINFIGIY